MKELKDFSNEAAKKLNISPEIAMKINSYFWGKGVKKNLLDLNYLSIYLKNLGTLNISKYKLYNDIEKEIGYIRSIRKSPKYTEKKRELVLESKRNKLRRMLKIRNQLLKQEETWED